MLCAEFLSLRIGFKTFQPGPASAPRLEFDLLKYCGWLRGYVIVCGVCAVHQPHRSFHSNYQKKYNNRNLGVQDRRPCVGKGCPSLHNSSYCTATLAFLPLLAHGQ